MSITQLWVERYRPTDINGYVFTDLLVREQIEQWIRGGSIPHLLFYGPPGTGKTTLARLLIHNLNVQDLDVLIVNGSKEGRKIDWLRDTLDSFCQTMPFGDYKIVLIDEADYLNPQSVQPALRNLMEEYSESVRFILTCNWVHKLIAPIKSRCHEIAIQQTDPTEFTARAATILVNENIEFELDDLDFYVKATYPDLRKCINLLQAKSVTGQLTNMRSNTSSEDDYRVEAVKLFKQGRLREARTLIVTQVRADEMEELYRWAYDNLDIWSTSDQGQDEAILIIRRGLVNHPICADPEINLSATLTELISIKD